MSCVHFGPVPSGAGPSLPHSSPKRTAKKIARLHQLALSDNIKHQCAAAGNPMTSLLDLYWLSMDANIEVRSWVLRNPACPKWLLAERAEKDFEKSLREFAKYRISMLDYNNDAR